MDTSPRKQPNRIPEHLRHLSKPGVTSTINLYRSWSPPAVVPSIEGVELSPRHWRGIPKRTLQETLKDVLLKDWLGKHRRQLASAREITPHKEDFIIRPTRMRMKDSDDYITARAANPRTGLISPSPELITPPQQLWTPETPGEALKIWTSPEIVSPCPTSYVKIRPPFQRTHQERKESTERPFSWQANTRERVVDTGVTVASPRIVDIKADAGLVASNSQPQLVDEDQFIVRMPSAREPQPHAYPGYSAKEIRAFEQYRAPIVDLQQPCSEVSSSGIKEIDVPERHEQRRPVSIDSYGRTASGVDATTFALFSSPNGVPVSATRSRASTAPRVLSENAVQPVRRKAVPVADLTSLPRVNLVHPSHAGIPIVHPLSQTSSNDHNVQGQKSRQCSLGCPQSQDGSQICIQRRRVASNSAVPPLKVHTLFDHQRAPLAMHPQQVRAPATPLEKSDPLGLSRLLHVLITVAVGAIEVCKNVQIRSVFPRIKSLDVLYAEDTTPQQKVSALKSMLASVGQALILLGVIAMVCQVGSMVVNMLEMVLWPLVMPFKVLRWVSGGG